MVQARRKRPLSTTLLLSGLLLLSALASPLAARDRLTLSKSSIPLPGAPPSIIATDLDGDGRRDLLILVAYTEWDQIGYTETTSMDDVEGLVEVLTIVPSLLDRRELHAYLRGPDGRWTTAGAPLPIDSSLHTLDVGPPGVPALATTDDGAVAVRLGDEPDPETGSRLVLESLFDAPSVLADTGTFVPGLPIVVDVDGDGYDDLLFPAPDGPVVYRATADGLATEPSARLRFALGDDDLGPLERFYPIPKVRDVDGDGIPDLLVHDPSPRRRGPPDVDTESSLRVARGLGDGHFADAVDPLVGHQPAYPIVHFGDLDGDSVAEWVSAQTTEPSNDAGMREELSYAKRPPHRYRLYRSTDELGVAGEPYQTFDASGYAFGMSDEDSPIGLPAGFQDLDGDGRQDLVTLTLDFSLFGVMRTLATKRLKLGLDFHVWCQQGDSRFAEVTGLDLSGTFKLDLNNLEIGQLSQFAGDFDGDGRADFVQLGRGKRVSIHRGQPGCRYPADPDLVIELDDEPEDLSLVQIRDLDGDERADLLVIQPQRTDDPNETAPIRLDLYLSTGGES